MSSHFNEHRLHPSNSEALFYSEICPEPNALSPHSVIYNSAKCTRWNKDPIVFGLDQKYSSAFTLGACRLWMSIIYTYLIKQTPTRTQFHLSFHSSVNSMAVMKNTDKCATSKCTKAAKWPTQKQHKHLYNIETQTITYRACSDQSQARHSSERKDKTTQQL